MPELRPAATVPGHAGSSHAAPDQPSSHSQIALFLHLPCSPQPSSGQERSEQSSPVHPGTHLQTPSTLLPPLRHTASSQPAPTRPGGQKQRLPKHWPMPEQPRGHAFSQPSPDQPSWHTHLLLVAFPSGSPTVTPCWPHSRRSQPSPPQPAGQAHVPLLQVPRPLQRCGQLSSSHASPVLPGGQTQRPLSQKPPCSHGAAHSGPEQSRPPKPSKQSHVPSALQTPLPEQRHGQLFRSHSLPSHPAKHAHVPLPHVP